MYYLVTKEGYFQGASKTPVEGVFSTQKPPLYSVYKTPRFDFSKDRWMGDDVPVVDMRYLIRTGFLHNLCTHLYEEPKENVLTRDKDVPVTVLIPCWKQNDSLAKAINSVLCQDYPNVHVEVSLMYEKEPGSMVRFAKHLEKDPRVKVFLDERTPVAVTRNRMINRCGTEWFIMLDADESFLCDNHISNLVAGKTDVVFARTWSEDRNGPMTPKEFLVGNPVEIMHDNMCCLMSKATYYAVGPFDEEEFLNAGEDTDYELRLLQSVFSIGFAFAWESKSLFNRGASKEFWKYQYKIFRKHKEYIKHNLEKLPNAHSLVKGFLHFYENPTYETFREIQEYEDQHSQVMYDVIKEIKKGIETMPDTEYMGEYSRITDEGITSIKGCKGHAYDAIIYWQPWQPCFKCQIPVDVRSDWVPIVKDMDDVQRMKYLIMNGYCVFRTNKVRHHKRKPGITYEDTDNIFEREFARLWYGKKEDIIHKEFCPTCPSLQQGRPVSFILSDKCDKACAYCNRGLCHEAAKDLNHSFEVFDKALTWFEQHMPGAIYPQILGGEPGILPDWLILKVQERLKKYKHKYKVFTNGAGRGGLWYTGPNIPDAWTWHITDWVGKKNIPLVPGEVIMIVVTKKDLPHIETFLQDNYPLDWRISVAPCRDSQTPGYDLDEAETQYLSDLLDKYGAYRNPVTGRKMDNCNHHIPTVSIDCANETMWSCQDPLNIYPLSELEERLAKGSCAGCTVRRC